LQFDVPAEVRVPRLNEGGSQSSVPSPSKAIDSGASCTAP
jgi:hypothetical protein